MNKIDPTNGHASGLPHPENENCGVWECKPVTITRWFTFGQTHAHSINGITFDKDTVVKITAEDPRKVMRDNFGDKWAMEYASEPEKKFWNKLVEL